MPSRVTTMFTVLLCGLASMLVWESTRQLDQPSTVIARSANRQIVRSYFANLNAYLYTGEIEPLSSMFEPDQGVAVLPGCGQFERETRWRSMKATYPDMSVVIRDEGVMGDESIVETELDSANATFPHWLPVAAGETPERSVEWFRLWETSIVDHRSTFQSSLALTLTDRDAETHLTNDSTIVIARLDFAPGQRTYERLPGPGLLLVIDGALDLVPDPGHRLNLVRQSGSDQPDPLQTLRSGDAVTAVAGVLVVRNSGSLPVSALYVSLQPLSESGGSAEGGAGGLQESVQAQEQSLDQALSGMSGMVAQLAGVDISILARPDVKVTTGFGVLHVALLLTDQPPVDWPFVAVARIRGPLDAGNGCPDVRSLFLVATYAGRD